MNTTKQLIRTTYWTRFDTNIRKDDKNVFEMKYSGATTNSSSSTSSKFDQSQKSILPKSSENDISSGDNFLNTKSSQQRLFKIDGKCVVD